jgi:hypothetical protein
VSETKPRRGIRVRCPLGGYAPCIDDMCHGVDQTMCGLWVEGCGFDAADVCLHGWVPETCPEGCADEYDDEPDDDFTSFDEEGRPI